MIAPAIPGSIQAIYDQDTYDQDVSFPLKRPTTLQLTRPRSQRQYGPTHNIHQVIEAWSLVYKVYTHSGLIDANPYRLHTVNQAVTPFAAVFHGSTANGEIESTATAIEDAPNTPYGLPLDQVYHDELNKLRNHGRRLIECGLFAHRGQLPGDDPQAMGIEGSSRQIRDALYELMRMAFYFGLNRCCTDWILGVHPRHARFYIRAFGFKQIADETIYPAVNDRPVVLLHGDLDTSFKLTKTPYVLKYCFDNPVAPSVIENRFAFKNNTLHPKQVQAFLASKLQEEAGTWGRLPQSSDDTACRLVG